MKEALNSTPIFTRHDLPIEAVQRHGVLRISEDLLQRVADFLVDGDEEKIPKVVTEVLNSRDPLEIINKSLIPGMKEVSRLWEIDAYFLPQVMLCSDALKAGTSLCEEKMGSTMKKKTKVITHTEEGNILDLSKIETSKLQLEQGDFALGTVLDHIRLQIGEAAQAKGLRVEIDGDNVPTWLRDGAGIGLAMAKRIGNRHGEGATGHFTRPSTNRGEEQ